MAGRVKQVPQKNILSMEKIIPAQIKQGRKTIVNIEGYKIRLYTHPLLSHCGHRSKEIEIKRFVKLDDLFFEGLGLWVGEGGRSKGLYFGNTSPELLQHFLNFTKEKIGIEREEFKATINVPADRDGNATKEKWSKMLQIPLKNFTSICLDPRINREYVQVYVNGTILAELMKSLAEKLGPEISSNERYAASFLRGIFAAEGQVALKKSGVLFHIDFSSANTEIVSLLKKCLGSLGISSGKYIPQSLKFPIYGRRNFDCIRELGIHVLHPEKCVKFELGLSKYKRYQMNGEEARALILQQLSSGPKTYDELAAALGKARTTIQAWHLTILERGGLVKRVGKRAQAWLWAPAEDKISPPPNVNRAPCAEPMPC